MIDVKKYTYSYIIFINTLHKSIANN